MTESIQYNDPFIQEKQIDRDIIMLLNVSEGHLI